VNEHELDWRVAARQAEDGSMITVLLAMLIFLLAVSGLALGIIFNRRPISGSCGDCMNCLCRKDR
jgi:hypothetical protein